MSSSLLGPFQPNIRPFAAVRLTAVALYHSMQILWSVIACQNALQISQKKKLDASRLQMWAHRSRTEMDLLPLRQTERNRSKSRWLNEKPKWKNVNSHHSRPKSWNPLVSRKKCIALVCQSDLETFLKSSIFAVGCELARSGLTVP